MCCSLRLMLHKVREQNQKMCVQIGVIKPNTLHAMPGTSPALYSLKSTSYSCNHGHCIMYALTLSSSASRNFLKI